MSAPAAVRVETRTPDETVELGRRIGTTLRPGDVVLLHGDLGAGKTTLVRGIAAALGVDGPIQSPTFVLVHDHPGRTADGQVIALHHLDLYRLGGDDEADGMGYADYLAAADGVTVVEWPERAEASLPDAYLLVEIEAGVGDDRRVALSAHGLPASARRWLAPFAP
jgi:tRNA threonylcarbamoyladenosine biosynthesis protein TsaE